ncbi:MAG: aldo/keto reductase [Chloroflexota bacterium]|nr:MAG: aldo/keto reductase [Chloroflexota bacterium]
MRRHGQVLGIRPGLPDISRLGYGAAPLGNVYGDIDPAEGIASVHRAIDRGITFFDVSPYYGLTVAEDVLGRALAGRRHEVVICTKAGRYDRDVFDFSSKGIQGSAQESLKRLRSDYVDILLAHDIEFGAPEQILGETIDALERLKRAGTCRYIGVSAYPPGVLRRAMEARTLDAIMSYCRYCLFNTDLQELIPLAERRGTIIFNASPLGMGLLSDSGPPGWHPASATLCAACERAAALCRERGARLSDLALQFALGLPGIRSTVIGMDTPALVDQNVESSAMEPDPELLSRIRQILAPASEEVWPSGRAEWEELPGEAREISRTGGRDWNP